MEPKREKYEAAGVPEYWVVDPERCTVEVLVLVKGTYERHALFGRDEVLRSQRLVGLEIGLAEVFPV